MKIALIGDVHGNLPALDAVLNDIREQGVKRIWNIGDFVGYGPFPDEVVKTLKKEKTVSIIGNYDLKVLKAKGSDAERPKPKTPEKWFAFNWAHDNLSDASRKYLESLPRELRIEKRGKKILLTHGSPASNEEHLMPDTPAKRFKELAKMARADIVVVGHSHIPFVREVDHTMFINTGSVGRPDDGDPRACYAVLRLKGNKIKVSHYRLNYDVDKSLQAIRDNGLPESFAQMLRQGRPLDQVLKGKPIPAPVAPPPAVPNEAEHLEKARALAEACKYEAVHTEQVTRLALRLFDELQPLHKLGPAERFKLNAAGLLHDIGWIEGQQGHHKTALRLILDSSLLAFSKRDRLLIGSVARYHRAALPSKSHDNFARLDPADRHTVCILAAILRVADGLDRTHENVVKDLACQVLPDKIVVRAAVKCSADEEKAEALDKGDLMQKVFGRKLEIVCRLA